MESIAEGLEEKEFVYSHDHIDIPFPLPEVEVRPEITKVSLIDDGNKKAFLLYDVLTQEECR